jgi:negative regulator of replication initiation
LHNAEKRNLAMADNRAGGESTSRVRESASDISRRVFIAWASGTEAAQRAEEAALEAFRTSVRAVEDMIEGKPPARSGR